MKLYDYAAAPNPRRARMFIAEKGLDIPVEQIDLMTGQQFSDDFKKVNSALTVPALELDDGTIISEVYGIWRYLEALHPTPALLGSDAKEMGLVAMWESRMLLEGAQSVAEAFRNYAKGFKGRALPGPNSYEQIPELVERGRARVGHFYEMLDARLGESEYVAGDNFSVADITAFVTHGFGGWIKMPIPDDHANAQRWLKAVGERPSAEA